MKDQSKVIGTDEFWEENPDILKVDIENEDGAYFTLLDGKCYFAQVEVLDSLGLVFSVGETYTRPKVAPVARVPDENTPRNTRVIAWDGTGRKVRGYFVDFDGSCEWEFLISFCRLDADEWSGLVLGENGHLGRYKHCEIFDPEIHGEQKEEPEPAKADVFEKGDTVRVTKPEDNHVYPEWEKIMGSFDGSEGEVIQIDSDGDFKVHFKVRGHDWTFHPTSLTLVKKGGE